MAGRTCISLYHNLQVLKSGARICPWCLPEWVVFEVKVGLVILVALTAHHIPI
jgi:hypothetical protein